MFNLLYIFVKVLFMFNLLYIFVKVLPVVIFFSTVISVLYYLGVMQLVILKLAWLMQRTLGTTAAESVNAAGNIFLGQVSGLKLYQRGIVSNIFP